MKFMELVTNFRNVALLVTALAGAAGTVYGVQSFFDDRYASKEEVQEVKKRLTLQELKNLLKEALEEMYFWRQQSRKYPEDEEIKKRLKESEEHVADIKKQINDLEKKELENE